MLGGLAACVMMLALGLSGVLALRRLTDRLTRLEAWAYGLPLGVVVGSLVLLALAIVLGRLSTALVLMVTAISAGGALALWKWRRADDALGAGLNPSGEEVATITPALTRVAAEARRLRGVIGAFGPLSTVILGAFILRWVLMWSTMLTYKGGDLWASDVSVWSDWALHLGDVTAFVYGDNFPPQNTRYAGGPLAYHYLTSITSAAFVKLGMDPAGALTLHSLVFSLLILFGLYAFALRLTGDRDAAGVSVGLFLLGGSLGWLVIASDINKSKDILGTLQKQPWNPWVQSDLGFSWPNMVFALLAPQRGYLYGLPLALLILTLLLVGVETKGHKYFVAAGLIAGTLPFAHTSTLVALALITPFVALLFLARCRAWVLNWALFFGLWLATAVPQLYLQQGGERGETSALRWEVGWVTANTHENWLWYWGKNLGWFIPLLAIALASRKLVPSASRRLLWAFMPTFVICNLVAFRPWDWDNTKFLFFWFLAVNILVAALLTKAWREHNSLLVRTMITGMVGTMILSGLLANYLQISGKDRNVELSADDLRVAEQVRDLTPPHATFAVSFQHNHPVPVMAGRRVVMSYVGWLYAFGIDYAQRERDVRAIYALAPDMPDLLNKYDVDYVVIGPVELQEFKPNVEAFRSRYQRIINTGNYEIFKVR